MTDNIKQSDKAKVFDWLVGQLENGTLEMLFKADSSGEHDFVSVSNFSALLGELEIQGKQLNRKKSANKVQLTMNQFNHMRKEIYSSYSQAGCMDEVSACAAERAYDACSTAERANLVPPLDY